MRSVRPKESSPCEGVNHATGNKPITTSALPWLNFGPYLKTLQLELSSSVVEMLVPYAK